MKPGTINLHIYRGDTWNGMGPFQIKVGASPPASDLASVRMQIRAKESGPVIVELTSADSAEISITSANDWRFTVPKQAIALNAGRYVYDIELTAADGTVMTPIAGNIKVDEDITRDA
jgi:hypothetical protein